MEIEVMKVVPLKVDFPVECEWCGSNHASLVVTMKNYEGKASHIEKGEEFDLCKSCKNMALDKYTEMLNERKGYAEGRHSIFTGNDYFEDR